MFHRPRCRDWSPLATQQLRLRNLIQISGHNIDIEPKSIVYYTLHFTTMSQPFFTSERMEVHTNVIWPEINCARIVKHTSQFVCIRVWRVVKTTKPTTTTTLITKTPTTTTITWPNESIELDDSQLKMQGSMQNTNKKESSVNRTTMAILPKHKGADETSIDENMQNTPDEQSSTTDQQIFLWGVYFSGLIPITKRSDVKLQKNALVFHMHGGFFTSAEYLLPECVPRQANGFFFEYSILMNLPQNQSSLATISSSPSKKCDLVLSKNGIAINSKLDQRRSEFLSPAFRNSMSQKPGSYLNINEVNQIPSLQPERSPLNSPRMSSLSSSPTHVIATTYDAEPIYDPHMLKMRFLQRSFYKLEIRPSYNVEKLLLLQEKQRRYRHKCNLSKEIRDRICMKSAFCLNLQLIANRALIYRPQPRGNPSMGRTLNRLLSPPPEQPKPEDLLRAQELRRKIETARFRCRLLTQERDHHKINLRQLRTKIGRISDENIDNESWLMENFRRLCRDRDITAEQYVEQMRQRYLLENASTWLFSRQKELLYQLKDIYAIECDQHRRFYKINGIYLPNSDAFSEFAVQSLTTASNISVALGYVAHVVMLCSIVLNIPLRNTVIYKGSASKMRDDIKVLSEHDREFPLFCRSIPPPDSFLYAVFLLNQNIAQIKFMLGLHGLRDDIRATLPNLMAILNLAETSINNNPTLDANRTSSSINGSGQLVAPSNVDSQANLASVSNSSVDLNVPVPVRYPVRNQHSMSDGELNAIDVRVNRSMRSFTDEASTRRPQRSNDQTMFYSEPILSTRHE